MPSAFFYTVRLKLRCNGPQMVDSCAHVLKCAGPSTAYIINAPKFNVSSCTIELSKDIGKGRHEIQSGHT